MARNKANTVLLARFSAIGDVAMTVPVIYSACRTYPEVRFVMVTKPFMTSIFVNKPENLTVVGFDVKDAYSGIGGIRRMVAELVGNYHPGKFIDLHNVLRTRMMSLFLRLRGVTAVHLLKPRAKRKELTRQSGKQLVELPSQRSLYRDAFSAAGFAVQHHFDGLYGTHGDAPVADFESITAPKPSGWKWIGIAPFAAHQGKIYPTDMMHDVVAILAREPRTHIFLFGGGGAEREVLEAWAAEFPACTSLAGKKYGFAAELALMNHLDVMLSMDSGNMHLAAIAGTKVVSIWGATHPFAGFTPWRCEPQLLIQQPLDCRPCSVFGNAPCRKGNYECLRSIAPQRVADKVIQSIK